MNDDNLRKNINNQPKSDTTFDVDTIIEGAQPTAGADNDNGDDVTFEENLDDSDVSAQGTIKKLREKLKRTEQEKTEYLDSLQRMKADYVNARKRDEESRTELTKYAIIGFIEELLPTIDAFEQAMANKQIWESVSPEWRTGMESVYGKITGLIQKNNITAFGSIGETFDPNLHHSIQVTPTTDKVTDGTIAGILQKGYKIGDKIIRPALVTVYEAQ